MLFRGSGRAPDHNRIAHFVWTWALEHRCSLRLERVPSEENLADEPSRQKLRTLQALGRHASLTPRVGAAQSPPLLMSTGFRVRTPRTLPFVACWGLSVSCALGPALSSVVSQCVVMCLPVGFPDFAVVVVCLPARLGPPLRNHEHLW